MRRLTCFILAALLMLTAVPLALEQTAQAATDYSTVRVLLGNSGSASITASVKGNYFIQETGASFSSGTLQIQYSGGKVVLTHSSAGQLYAGSSVNIMRESYSPSAGYISMSVNGATRYYLGNFLFKAHGSGIRVVNTVPIQHYLYGVVAFEMSNNFPLEALKAQAVAAKCYVLSGMAPSSDYDIGDTANDQVYKGYNSSYTSVMAAVDATYDVWLYLGNSILCSYFAASNGGQTILPSDTWSGTNRYIWDSAYDRREDPYDIANPLTVQETTFYPANGDAGQISSALSNYLRNRSTDLLRKQQNDGGLVVTYIEAIHSMTSRTSTSADINLTVTAQFSNGAVQSINYAYTEDFAYLTANGVFTKPQSLRLYVITQKNGGWELRRGRYGHGVGLSQRGAEQMANQGMNYQQILKFYYPGAQIRSMGLTMPSDPVNNNTNSNTTPVGDIIATAITTGNVNFRQGPSTKTSSLGKVPKNTNLNVYAQQDGFSQVQYNNQTGYVSNTYLKLTPVSSGNTTPPDTGTSNSVTMYGEVTSSTLNFREQPNTGGKKIATLKKGAKLDIYGYAPGSSSWYSCAYNGKNGYVSVQYVKITGQATVADPPPTDGGSSGGPVTAGSTGTVTQNNVYMRSEATNSSGRRIIGLAKGVTVTVTGESGDFYAATITYQGNTYTGYVEKQYLSVASAPSTGNTGNTGNSGNSTQQGQTTGKVNFRKGPGTKYGKIKQLKKGTALTILSHSNGWYEVTVDGTTGYVSDDYVKVTGGSSGNSAGSNSNSSSSTSTGKVVKETTRLRSSASAANNSNILGEYPVGTEMTVHFQEGDFYKVTINGQDGYMHKDYVEISASSSGSSASTTGNVNFRSGPSTSGTKVLKVLSRGTSVTVLGTEGDFYYVQVGPDKGYLSKKYVKVS